MRGGSGRGTQGGSGFGRGGSGAVPNLAFGMFWCRTSTTLQHTATTPQQHRNNAHVMRYH